MGAQPAGDNRAETTKLARETWRDWCAPGAPGTPGKADPELLTRDELLETVERWGVKRVQGSTLRYWEGIGLLPRATIAGPPGKQRALYPWWAADLAALVRHYQDDEREGDDRVLSLRDRTRAAALTLSHVKSGRWLSVRPALVEAPFGPRPLPAEVAGDLLPPLARLVRDWRERGTLAVESVEIRVNTGGGEAIIYVLPGDEVR